MGDEIMLRFDHVVFRYEDQMQPVVNDLSFEVPKGRFISLIGKSGCGKSTIFRLVNSLLIPESGTILVDGKDIRGQKSYCGYMPQNDLLFPWRNVLENVKVPLELKKKYSKAEMDRMAMEALENAGLSEWAMKRPGELSGGMRQRVSFARTVLTGCDLMLLDEPFSALDYMTRLSMREWLLKQWEKEKKTILFITHDVEEALYLSDTILMAEEKPITQLRKIEVPAGYPRSRESLKRKDMLDLKEELIERLRGESQ